MAPNSIKIEIEPTIIIKPGVANLCLKALELFINQNPELDIIGQRLPDGSIMLKFVERGLSESPKEDTKDDEVWTVFTGAESDAGRG